MMAEILGEKHTIMTLQGDSNFPGFSCAHPQIRDLKGRES